MCTTNQQLEKFKKNKKTISMNYLCIGSCFELMNNVFCVGIRFNHFLWLFCDLKICEKILNVFSIFFKTTIITQCSTETSSCQVVASKMFLILLHLQQIDHNATNYVSLSTNVYSLLGVLWLLCIRVCSLKCIFGISFFYPLFPFRLLPSSNIKSFWGLSAWQLHNLHNHSWNFTHLLQSNLISNVFEIQESLIVT